MRSCCRAPLAKDSRRLGQGAAGSLGREDSADRAAVGRADLFPESREDLEDQAAARVDTAEAEGLAGED